MTELMKRYEKETGGDAIILYEKHISDEFARWSNNKYLELQAENAQLKARIAELEEQLYLTVEEVYAMKAQLAEQTVEKFQEIIRNQCDEISTLKAKVAELEEQLYGRFDEQADMEEGQ